MRCESCSCILDNSPYCFSSKENPFKCESCVESEKIKKVLHKKSVDKLNKQNLDANL